MATNPLYNNNDSPNNSTQPTKAVNRQAVNVKRTHNTFDNSYYNYKTQKFGQYEPFFAMECVAGDYIPLSSSHNVRSLPMSSPFLSQLKLNKDYFMCPMQAILPNTWEYIFKNPSQGDDVPDNANCLFPAYSVDLNINIFQSMWDFCMDGSQSLSAKFRMLLCLEMFLSQGSLLSQLGYHLNPRIKPFQLDTYYSFDAWFDGVIRSINFIGITYNGSIYAYDSTMDPDGIHYISMSQMLNLLRVYGSECVIANLVYNDTDFTKLAVISDLPSFSTTDDFGTDINLSRVIAYQLSCSQFYVNPQIDYLYNAQLYRDNIYTLWKAYIDKVDLSSSDVKFFTYNGIKVPYDYLSKAYFEDALFVAINDSKGFGVHELYDYLYAIFGHRESLRFGDYFTDSRTRPLALGNDNISVSSDSTVSVIDVSKSIVYQRFRNAVVKLGNNFGDYLRGIFNSEPSPDYHYPKFISHQDFDISGFEVENNTSEGQGNLVTNLSSRDDSMAFEVQIDMPCVLIGISYFSVPRVYMQTKDRHFFHRDRYDMFNPMLQYIGDQIVYNHERTDLRPNDEIFGYQSRNNEYKQRYSVVSGGFATLLPAWTFVSDSMFNPIDDVILHNNQSPEYIRAHDYEFNRFFQRMPGYSLANGFHFIMVYNNKCMSTRPMEVNPNIL